MNACYDLQRCPPTYDVVAYLALLELERLRIGAESIDLRILPGPNRGFRRDSLWPPLDEREAIRERLLVPLCWLLPSVQAVSVLGNRQADGWGKGGYHISLPAILQALRGGSRPLRARYKYEPAERPFITFTLREAVHHPLRNSRTDEWALAAAEVAENTGLDIVVIRDTRLARTPLLGAPPKCGGGRLLQAGDAPHNLEARAGLYSTALLNVGICNGPMWMAIFMDAPVLMLRPTTNAAAGCYDDRFYSRYGLPPGAQLPTSPPHQRLVWEDDTRDNIVREIDEMLGVVA